MAASVGLHIARGGGGDAGEVASSIFLGEGGVPRRVSGLDVTAV